jgi:transcriptional regulator with XRE-family HTH domain
MPSRKKKLTTMTERLRNAVNDCPLPFQALERETGVLRQTLMKFARGETSLRLDMADKLAAYFGLELTERETDNG